MYGSPVSLKVQLGDLVATILIIFVSIMIMTIVLLYLLRRLQLCGVVFEVAKVKKK
jgi:hypothetical protein